MLQNMEAHKTKRARVFIRFSVFRHRWLRVVAVVGTESRQLLNQNEWNSEMKFMKMKQCNNGGGSTAAPFLVFRWVRNFASRRKKICSCDFHLLEAFFSTPVRFFYS